MNVVNTSLAQKKKIMISVFSILVLLVLTCGIFSNMSPPLAQDLLLKESRGKKEA